MGDEILEVSVAVFISVFAAIFAALFGVVAGMFREQQEPGGQALLDPQS
ncbi:MAG TPA: hypothetical protein VJT08_03070 [Terriglobales bacterium]|nr:hypothetical protein [Terriglobales bacterium]